MPWLGAGQIEDRSCRSQSVASGQHRFYKLFADITNYLSFQHWLRLTETFSPASVAALPRDMKSMQNLRSMRMDVSDSGASMHRRASITYIVIT